MKSEKKAFLIVFGTRPEIIKLAPLIQHMQAEDAYLITLCNTGQHRELSHQALSYFNITADIHLDLMRERQKLAVLQARILTELQSIVDENSYDAIIAQGDTMTVFCSSLVAFYNKIPFFHVEAGLRSYDIHHPFPEEYIRRCIAAPASLHFAPTTSARDALLKENINENIIIVTGNTAVDAVLQLAKQDNPLPDYVPTEKEMVLVTTHRRENHGKPLNNILQAILTLAKQFPNIQYLIPVHPNPAVGEKTKSTLADTKNITLLPALDYPELIQIMSCSKLIITDSGGIQEEAPSFGCPTLVTRKTTERREGVEAGFATLTGANTDTIVTEATHILTKDFASTRLDGKQNPYGDGHAAERINKAIQRYFFGNDIE